MSGVAAVRQLRPQSRNMSRKQAIAEYANAAVVPLVDPLVRSLLVEQPEDPAAFCQAYFQKTLGSGKGPSTPEGVETVSPELVALQQRIAALEAENQALQAEAAATPSVAVAAPEVAGTEAFVVNWNLAGVNTNAFEFHLSEDPLFADAIAFARDTDDVVRTVLRADRCVSSYSHNSSWCPARNPMLDGAFRVCDQSIARVPLRVDLGLKVPHCSGPFPSPCPSIH
eukprot:SAG11_NODE_679_length_7786_cov_6.173670_2_plen_226_part_00